MQFWDAIFFVLCACMCVCVCVCFHFCEHLWFFLFFWHPNLYDGLCVYIPCTGFFVLFFVTIPLSLHNRRWTQEFSTPWQWFAPSGQVAATTWQTEFWHSFWQRWMVWWNWKGWLLSLQQIAQTWLIRWVTYCPNMIDVSPFILTWLMGQVTSCLNTIFKVGHQLSQQDW